MQKFPGLRFRFLQEFLQSLARQNCGTPFVMKRSFGHCSLLRPHPQPVPTSKGAKAASPDGRAKAGGTLGGTGVMGRLGRVRSHAGKWDKTHGAEGVTRKHSSRIPASRRQGLGEHVLREAVLSCFQTQVTQIFLCPDRPEELFPQDPLQAYGKEEFLLWWRCVLRHCCSLFWANLGLR